MPSQATPLSRNQRLWLAAAVTIAAALRFSELGSLSLSHMDEGGYVSSAITVANFGPYSFPYSQALQAPPLLPWLIGAMIWLTQAQWPILGVLLSGVFGTSSVLLIFLLGRRWGGNQFGLCAATLLALSDFHVAYSRMVLTDVPLTFWFLLTLYCVTRMWELAEQATMPDKPNRSGPKTRSSPQRDAPSLSRRWLWCLALGAATGLASAAAWNTKYNGWLVLAIAATAAGLWILKECLLPSVSKADGWGTRSAMLLGGLLLAAVIAVACFTHWYLYVEWRFPGGNEAVTINHRRYFSSPTAWPAHAYRLIASLAALRHYGWIATLALVPVISFRLATRPLPPEGNSQRVKSVIVSLVLSLGLAIVVLVQGGDAALLFLGIAGILPALLSGSWPRLLAAVWCGTFFVLTPLYHPYPRLMLPALPACMYLSLWLLEDLWPGILVPVQNESTSVTSYPRRITAGVSLAGGAALALVWLLGPHPFGAAAPSPGIWGRWTTRASYRAAREQILEYTDADAIIFCQTQLAMYCYCPRTAVVTEDHSYRTLFEGYPRDRTCYLAVDFSWIHDTPNSEALRGILDHLDELTPVAVIPNDLCIVTLLDFLPPSEAAAKLAADLPSYRVGPEGRFPLPPPLSAPYEDVIILYRAKLPESLPP